MFTDQERAYFLAQARKAYQARLDAAAAAKSPRDARLAWAYALLDEAEIVIPVHDDPGIAPDGLMDAAPAPRKQPGLAMRALESPARVTLWVMAIGAVAMLAIAVLDALHLPGVRYPISRTLNDLASWFPANVIVSALLVFGLAKAARWMARRFFAEA